MSFSSEIKKELCSAEVFDRELLKAELYGMLLFGKTFSESRIVFKTENTYACKRITFLLQNLYMPIIEKQSALRTKSKDFVSSCFVMRLSRLSAASAPNAFSRTLLA